MGDKTIMNTILTYTKNSCELLMHGAIESSTPKIKTNFINALEKYLEIQGNIFKEMENAGLYNIENVNETKINKTCSKHESSLN